MAIDTRCALRSRLAIALRLTALALIATLALIGAIAIVARATIIAIRRTVPTLLVGTLAILTIISLGFLTATILALKVSTRPVIAILVATILVGARTVIPVIVVPLVAGLFACADRFAFGTEIIVAVRIIPVVKRVVRWLATRLVVLEPATLFAQYPKIMIRELQIIFDVDAITRQLRVAGEILVFLVQLRGIAARATIDTVAVVAALVAALTRIAAPTATIVVTTTTATAAGLPIIDQACVLVLKTKTGLAPKSAVQTPDRAPSPAQSVCHGRRTAATS